MRLDESFPVYPRVGERDVNLFLLEELVSSETFQIRIFASAGIDLRARPDASGVLAFTEVCLPGGDQSVRGLRRAWEALGAATWKTYSRL
jgi:hypothetical protein